MYKTAYGDGGSELYFTDEIGEDYRLTVLSIIEELDECYNVLGQLDINNTIDHKQMQTHLLR